MSNNELTAKIYCEAEDCGNEGLYCVSLTNSRSASNLIICCRDHVGDVACFMADDGQDATVYRPSATVIPGGYGEALERGNHES